MFNRSRLTRLIVDKDWNKRVWDESWEDQRLRESSQRSLGEEGETRLLANRSKGEKRERDELGVKP